MSLRIRPPINAPDEWFDEVERVFNSKVVAAGQTIVGRKSKPAAPSPPEPEPQTVFITGEPQRENLPQPKQPGAPDASAAKVRPKFKRQSATLQDYGERLVKLIPSEVVGIYLVGVGVIPAAAKISVTVWAIICLGLVVLARAYGTREPKLNLPPQWKAVLISSISFVIWVYTIPGAFQSFGLAVPYVGSLAILVWTFVVPYFYTRA